MMVILKNIVCCNECLMYILSDKRKCFICNSEIETTEERIIEKKGNINKEKVEMDIN